MKTRTIIVTFTVVTLLAVLSALAIHRQTQTGAKSTPSAAGEQSFVVKGRILSIEPGGKMLHIAHEEIPDFMPAMAMPFSVKRAEITAGLTVGDSVRFHLLVTRDDSWISGIEKTGESLAPAASKPFDPNQSDRVETGQAVPNFALLDQDNRPIHLADFRGQAVIVTYIYTRCPLPNFCPFMSKSFAELQNRLSKKYPGKVHLLSVSFDPEFDTPTVLKEYAGRFEADSNFWSFATGTQKQIDFVAGLFGLIKEKETAGFSHDLRTALISPEGKLVHLWRSNFWTAEEIEAMTAETLAR